jgi:hypothetical protein
LQETDKWATYFAAETERLIEKRSLDHIGKSGKVQYVDIVGDVINMLPVHWICQRLVRRLSYLLFFVIVAYLRVYRLVCL